MSMLECLAEWMTVPALYARYGGGAPARNGMRHATIVPYGPYACADGRVNLAVQNAAQWERLCRVVLERPDLVDDPRFASNEDRVRARATLEPLIEAELGRWSVAEVRDRLVRADVPFGDVNDVDGLLRHPQLEARDRWQDVDTPGGAVRLARPPFAANSVVELMHKQCYTLPERPAMIASDIPQELDEFVCTLLDKNPARRPGTAAVEMTTSAFARCCARRPACCAFSASVSSRA